MVITDPRIITCAPTGDSSQEWPGVLGEWMKPEAIRNHSDYLGSQV